MSTRTARERTRGRGRMWARRGLRALLACCAFAFALFLVVVHSLDRPWMKRRVQALVERRAGVAIDYGTVQVRLLSGIDIADLVVYSPPAVKEAVPELARVERISVQWSLRSLWHKKVEDVRGLHVAATVAVDENGATTFDAFPPSNEPATPLSHKPAALLGAPLPVDHIGVEDVSVTLVTTKKGAETSRTIVRGISIDASAHSAGDDGPSRLDVRLGDVASPLDLDVEQRGDRTGGGHARLCAFVVATPTSAVASLEAHLTSQTFLRDARIEDALNAHVRARFRPDSKETDIEVDAHVADGAASSSYAELSIPDDQPIRVRWAGGDVDLARALALVPSGLVPVELERGKLRYRVARAVLAQPPRMEDGGFVSVDGDVSALRVRLEDNRTIRVGDASVALRVLPAPDGNDSRRPAYGGSGDGQAWNASVALRGIEASTGASTTNIDKVTLETSGTQDRGGALEGKVELGVASLDTKGPASVSARVSARGTRLTAVLHGIHIDPSAPLTARGDVVVSGEVASLDTQSPGARTSIAGIAVRAHAPLDGGAPYSADANVSAARVQAFDGANRSLVDAPAHVELRLSRVAPNTKSPSASTGVGHVEAKLGDLHATVDATKAADAVDFNAHAEATTLAAARAFLTSEATAQIPLDRMTVALDWNGRLERLSSSLPTLHEHAKAEIVGAAVGPIASRSITFELQSQGTTMVHEGKLDLRAAALAIPGLDTRDEHITLEAKIDRPRRALHVDVTTDGRASSKLGMSASFDEARRGVVYAFDGELSHLESLHPLLAAQAGLDGIDVSKLEIAVSGKGELFGVVSDVSRDGATRFTPNPALTAVLSGDLGLDVRHFVFTHGDVAVAVPKLGWHGDFRATPEGRELQSRLDVPVVHVAAGPRVLDASGISDKLSVLVSGSLENPDALVTEHVTMHALDQDAIPNIPVGDVALDVSAHRDHAGVVRLQKLALQNTVGGSSLSVSGTLDVNGLRRTLALRGTLEQDLAKATREPSTFVGRGKLSVTMRAESGDLVDFLTRADVRLDGVDAQFPRAHVNVESVFGEIPINLAFRVTRRGFTLVKGTHASPYAMLRFSDQHPLLSQSSFLRIQRIESPFVSIAPLVANVQIDRNIIAVPQFEMGVRNGRVTGQTAFDWQGEDSTLELHVRATGVLSSHGEPFDGNAAITFSAKERSVEGRAEILRIGKRHLLDLLDLEDPPHADASVNRVRSALALGFPERVRLGFDHGFMNAHIELGGLGSLLSIGELRGIPMGPVIDRVMSPVSRRKGTR